MKALAKHLYRSGQIFSICETSSISSSTSDCGQTVPSSPRLPNKNPLGYITYDIIVNETCMLNVTLNCSSADWHTLTPNASNIVLGSSTGKMLTLFALNAGESNVNGMAYSCGDNHKYTLKLEKHCESLLRASCWNDLLVWCLLIGTYVVKKKFDRLSIKFKIKVTTGIKWIHRNPHQSGSTEVHVRLDVLAKKATWWWGSCAKPECDLKRKVERKEGRRKGNGKWCFGRNEKIERQTPQRGIEPGTLRKYATDASGTGDINSQSVRQFHSLCLPFTPWASSNGHKPTRFAQGTRDGRHCVSRMAWKKSCLWGKCEEVRFLA